MSDATDVNNIPMKDYPVHIEDIMHTAYLQYSLSVNVGRAIPDVRDGLKPVNRRILYGMKQLGLSKGHATVKSARVVGEVMGKYHPHGDAAVYDALVRLAQPFSMRAPLIEGQGNFGTIDGDPAAASRYTECRMERLAEELLADLDKDTVNMIPNFDESETEPEVLPARYPQLLVNGTTGIGVGMLLLFVAVAVAIFLTCGFRVKNYAFLEKEAFETEYGVSGMVRERENAFAATYARLNIVGVVLCILAAVPLILAACMGAEDKVASLTVCLLLFFVGCGCYAFVRGGVYHGAMEQLLEEGDYTRENKQNSGLVGAISGCYWLIVTAVYLYVTFGPVGMTPDRSWFIWAVGGVLFGALMAVVGVLMKKNK